MLADFELHMIETFVSEYRVSSVYSFPRRQDEALLVSIKETANGMLEQYAGDLIRNHGKKGNFLWDGLCRINQQVETALTLLPPIGSRLNKRFRIVEIREAVGGGNAIGYQPQDENLHPWFPTEEQAIRWLEEYGCHRRCYQIVQYYAAH